MATKSRIGTTTISLALAHPVLQASTILQSIRSSTHSERHRIGMCSVTPPVRSDLCAFVLASCPVHAPTLTRSLTRSDRTRALDRNYCIVISPASPSALAGAYLHSFTHVRTCLGRLLLSVSACFHLCFSHSLSRRACLLLFVPICTCAVYSHL